MVHTWEQWQGCSGWSAVQSLAPEPARAIDRLWRTAPVGGEVAAAVRAACAGASGVGERFAPARSAPDDRPQIDAAIVHMAEQFSVDVSAVDEPLRERFSDACGDDTFAVIQAVYVADMVPRAMAALDALFGGAGSWTAGDPPAVVGADESWAAIEELLVTVHQLTRLDAVLTEVVRLRGARQHDCRLCKSLRSRPALVAGATEDLFQAIDVEGWSGLSARAATALRLTDAIIWEPANLAQDLLTEVRGHFDPPEAVELVLDVVRNASNKIAVALGADAPNVTDGVEVYEIDQDGVARYGLDAP